MFGTGWRDLESGLYSTGSCLIVLFCCCFHWSLSHSCSCGRCIILDSNFCKFLKGVGISLPVSLDILRSDTLKGHFTQNELKSGAFHACYWSSNIIPLRSLQANVNILFCMKILHVSACEPRRLFRLFTSQGVFPHALLCRFTLTGKSIDVWMQMLTVSTNGRRQ